MDLQGKVAIVTGSSSGIGESVAVALGAAGVSVVVNSSTSVVAGQAVAAALPDAIYVQGNVADEDACRALVAAAVDRFGRLDILVNNAGITIDRTVAKMTDEDWNKVIAVNLSGAFFMAQAAVEHMIERGTGRIISVSSVIGETGNIGQANYAASKSGLFGLTKSLAKEAIFQLSRSQRPVGDGIGLTVNAVTPGFIATDMLATVPDKVLDRIRAQIPVGRLGRPEEIARVVGFLGADESAYITGQVWAVNGGLDM
jgi:NAD(P)-dependent dehydrogenase (short-subunit alcohol dehydrogenase family)